MRNWGCACGDVYPSASLRARNLFSRFFVPSFKCLCDDVSNGGYARTASWYTPRESAAQSKVSLAVGLCCVSVARIISACLP